MIGHFIKFATRTIAIAMLICCLALEGMTLAGSGFAVPWWTVDAGGGQSSGGAYTVTGTLGQPDSGTMAGGDFRVNGGFWNTEGASLPSDHELYLPLVIR